MAIAGSLAAVGAVISGVATIAATIMQVQTMQMNADIEEENARRAIDVSAVQQQESDLAARAMLGEQLSAQAASGVNVGSTSPVLTRMAAKEAARMDALNIRQAGELEAYNSKAAAASLRAQAGVAGISGMAGALGDFLKAGSSIGNAKPVVKKNYFPPIPTPRQRILA